MPALEWEPIDNAAVDTARILAADAVEKVGNGHPGTAMSLALAAYLLFQKVTRRDPSDNTWIGRDRFILSAGPQLPDPVHPAVLRRLRAGARRPRGAAHLGLQDARPPRVRAHRRCRDHHRTARPGHLVLGGVRLRLPLRAGPSRPGCGARHEPVRPLRLRDLQRRRPAGGRQQRGLLARRPPAARQPDRDLRQQPDLDRGRHQHRLHGRGREALRGLSLARRRRSTGRRPASTSRTSRRCTTRSRRRRRSPTNPRSSSSRRSSAGRARTSRTRARSTVRRSVRTSCARSRRCSGSTPS